MNQMEWGTVTKRNYRDEQNMRNFAQQRKIAEPLRLKTQVRWARTHDHCNQELQG